MLSVKEHIHNVNRSNSAAFLAFVMGGDQPLGDLGSVCTLLAECGTDAIEIGLPFSDPIADGPVIQAAAQRALARGVSATDAIRGAAEFGSVPKIAMGYCNVAMSLGWDGLAGLLADSGFSAAILSDLIPEEADDWCNAAKSHRIETVFLVAPTSTEERIKMAAERTTGFLYAVGRTGVTGGVISDGTEGRRLVETARKHTDLPIGVGFGISNAESAGQVAEYADAVIVGSALVNLLNEKWGSGAGEAEIREYVKGISAAVH